MFIETQKWQAQGDDCLRVKVQRGDGWNAVNFGGS
jgi:hypothetical protein